MNYFEEALKMVIEGYEGTSQQGEYSVYKRGCPLNGEITDDMDANLQERIIRAMIYPPYSYAKYRDVEIKTVQELNILKKKQ